MTFQPQPVITEDNLVVQIDTVLYFTITDPKAVSYEVANPLQAIEQLTVTTLRNVIGGMTLEDSLTSRDNINPQLRVVLDEATGSWGIRINRVELKSVDPPATIQEAMEKQMRAERDKRARSSPPRAPSSRRTSDVNEPTVEDAIAILKGLKPYFEDYHRLKYTNEAIEAAVQLSSRYIHDRKLPDKAIDVIDKSGAAQMLVAENRRKKTIGIKEIETTIATMARIPPKSVSKDDAEVLKHLEQTLKRVVFGQDKAMKSLSASIKLARAGLREPEKPIGSYLFLGPTGVGKTEVAKQLAASLGVELLRFDMSEYMERHTVSRLIGAPPGYVGFDQGGLLTDGVDQHPHCVVLLDEIEKAHPDLYNVLLQIMDHGRLTDHNGRQINFRNVILIMTTNAGAADLARRPSASRATSGKATTTRRSTASSRPNSATGWI